MQAVSGFRKPALLQHSHRAPKPRMCKRLTILDNLRFSMADGIRKSANQAVHGTVPSQEECRDRLEQTREVLRHLYETPVPDLLPYVGPVKRKKERGGRA